MIISRIFFVLIFLLSEMIKILASCIGTKFIARWTDLMCGLALDAVKTVYVEENGVKEIDIKRYAKIEKVYLCFLFSSFLPSFQTSEITKAQNNILFSL